MGILNRLFGKHDNPPEKRQMNGNLAFVLLSEPQLPSHQEIADAFRDFAEPEETILEADDDDKTTHDEIISLKFNTGENCFVLLAPIAVPKGEADRHARFSLSSFRNNWTLPPHSAHLVVTLQSPIESTPIVQLSRFTSLLAAVIKSSPAVGVYWGNAGATHDSDFFISIASEKRVVPRMTLWSGVRIARESDGRLGLLSLGMKQLNLPDLVLVADKSRANDALATMFDLLTYVAQRGEALPEGDTVGRSDDERLRVHYVRSPIDSAKKVWRVELP